MASPSHDGTLIRPWLEACKPPPRGADGFSDISTECGSAWSAHKAHDFGMSATPSPGPDGQGEGGQLVNLISELLVWETVHASPTNQQPSYHASPTHQQLSFHTSPTHRQDAFLASPMHRQQFFTPGTTPTHAGELSYHGSPANLRSARTRPTFGTPIGEQVATQMGFFGGVLPASLLDDEYDTEVDTCIECTTTASVNVAGGHLPDDVPCPIASVGSIGHPLKCAMPCKYFQKKSRGCKDGQTCERCHLCHWRPAENRRRRAQAAQQSRTANDSPKMQSPTARRVDTTAE
mmetsp:Transcript_61128/g.138112  ORF Transcript_61128/g.138112 Transcript_61128/m.138112 type:complete len:291 (+) Transcript_61128:61-933(+)